MSRPLPLNASVHPKPVAHLHDEEIVARRARRIPQVARVDELGDRALVLAALLPDEKRGAAGQPFPAEDEIGAEGKTTEVEVWKREGLRAVADGVAGGIFCDGSAGPGCAVDAQRAAAGGGDLTEVVEISAGGERFGVPFDGKLGSECVVESQAGRELAPLDEGED